MIVIPDPNLTTTDQQEVYRALVAAHPDADRLGGMRLRVPDGTSHRKLTGAVQVERGVTTAVPGGRRKRKPANRSPKVDPSVNHEVFIDPAQTAAEAPGYGQLEAETPTAAQVAAELGVPVEELHTDREVRDPNVAPVDLTTLPPPPAPAPTSEDPEGFTWDELDEALTNQPAPTEGTPPEDTTAPTTGDTTTPPEEG